MESVTAVNVYDNSCLEHCTVAVVFKKKGKKEERNATEEAFVNYWTLTPLMKSNEELYRPALLGSQTTRAVERTSPTAKTQTEQKVLTSKHITLLISFSAILYLFIGVLGLFHSEARERKLIWYKMDLYK
eukprot:gene10041-7016_t